MDKKIQGMLIGYIVVSVVVLGALTYIYLL
jgi:hypothetical protein